MCTILWVDDNVEHFGFYAEALRKAGYSVTTAATVEEAERHFEDEKAKFDLVLIDLDMPERDGFVLIEFLTRGNYAGRMAVLSSYLYLDKYRQKLSDMETAVFLIDKDFPPVDDPHFDIRFLEPIQRVVNGEGRQLFERGVSAVEKWDPFDIGIDDFALMSIEQKDALCIRAKRDAKDLIDSAFRSGAMWVMLCGSKSAIQAQARTSTEIMSESAIANFGRLQGKVPYIFFRPVNSEDLDLGWAKCGSAEQMSDYPTVKIQFAKSVELLVHFDTGSPMTFFSYEELIDKGVILPGQVRFGPCERGAGSTAMAFMGANLNIEVNVLKNELGDTKQVKLTGLIVRDWLRAPFVRHCVAQKCVQLSRVLTDGRNCKVRVGLVGRNILFENRLRVTLDGETRSTTVS